MAILSSPSHMNFLKHILCHPIVSVMYIWKKFIPELFLEEAKSV